MYKEHRNALERSLHVICQDLDADDILPYLRSKEIIQKGQAQDIMKITRTSRQNMQLIDFIKEAGPSAFQEFINALQTCNKKHLAEKILAHLPSSSTQQIMSSEMNTAETPSTSSTNSSQPDTEDWQQKLKIAQQSLKEMYMTRFQKVYPFSFPFTFDIENTWVSLALKEWRYSQATEDHAKLLQTAFEKAKMLIIEGNPATGKTSLMRRLAYEWATGKKELLPYDLIIYAEFREVREKTFESIADLVLCYSKNYLTEQGYKNLKKLGYNEQFCKEYRILVLLDGYDESSLETQCSEFSSYMKEKTINKQLFFNAVITTRKGYLSNFRGREGRFVFAEVLGFTTKQQKEKYIFNHFLSSEIDNKHNIAAVHYLLDNNENLNKLAETPLFLTFICLVHERIIDGTLLELYCNIIWWLIDRHQQDFPDRDIPALFGFRNGTSDKFETIQNYFLQFPQLLCLSNMALRNLKENVFEPSDCAQFNLRPIIEQVGLLRKEKKHDKSFKLLTSFHFPHRTIQEFLAAFYCFCSKDPTNEWLLPESTLDTSEKSKTHPSGMNEFERFLLRIALSDKMPIQAEKRKYYFERIIDIKLNLMFEVFHKTAGFDSNLLNWFLAQCTNVQNINLNGKLVSTRQASSMLNDTSVNNESDFTSGMVSPAVFLFNDLMKLQSLTFNPCAFGTNSQLCITNCSSLKYLKFNQCEMGSSTKLDVAILPAIDTVDFEKCTFKANSQLCITNCLSLKNLKFHRREMESSTKFGIATAPATDTVKFEKCTFKANSQLSFANCPFLKNLKFHQCEMESSTNFGIATSPAIDTVEFEKCTFSANSQLSFTNCLSLKNLRFSECKFEYSTDFDIATSSATDTVEFDKCTFEDYSQLLFRNCPSLKNLQFDGCELKSSVIVDIAELPAIETVEFSYCKTDLVTWWSFIDQIRNSFVKCLQLIFGPDFNKEFLIHLQKCINIDKMEITTWGYIISQNDLLSFTDLIKLHSLTFEYGCIFEANSQLSITNCPSLKNLIFRYCKMKSSTIVGIAELPAIETVEFEVCSFEVNSQLSFTNCPSLKNLKFDQCKMKYCPITSIATLPSIDTVQFRECKIDLATWQSITDQIRISSVKCLKLSADFFLKGSYPEFLHHLQKCERIEQIHVNDIYDQSIRVNILSRDEESVTAILALTALKLPALRSITILDEYGRSLDKNRRLSERNRKRIEKAGQQRNPQFLIEYVE